MGIVRFSCRMVMQWEVLRARLLDKRCSRKARTLHEMHRPESSLREQVRFYQCASAQSEHFFDRVTHHVDVLLIQRGHADTPGVQRVDTELAA